MRSRLVSASAVAFAACLVAVLAASGCNSSTKGDASGGITAAPDATLPVGPAGAGAWILPNGRRIEPAGTMVGVDAIPLGVALSADERTLFVTSDGERGRLTVSAIDTATHTVLSSLAEPQGLYLGLALAPDGRTLYASGGGAGRVFVLDWDGAALSERSSFDAGAFPAGSALSPDGSVLYVATQTANGLASYDTATGERLGSVETGKNPFAVLLSPDGTEAYVSAERDGTVGVFDVRDPRAPRQVTAIPVQKNPEGMALTGDGTQLFVANADEDSISLVDLRKRKVTASLDLRTLDAQAYGTGPNAVAWSRDGKRVYVAQAVANRIAVIDVASRKLVGAIPTAWYPTAVAVSSDGKRLYVANAKGTGIGPNDVGAPNLEDGNLVDQATVEFVDVPSDADLATLAAHGDQLNARSSHLFDVNEAAFRNPIPLERGGATPIEHVFLLVRENKTYDAVLGDFTGGKPENCLYCGDPTPNLHALVERFASGDNYYTNAETSDQGHQLLTSGTSNTFVEKNEFAENRPVPFEVEIYTNPAVWPKRQYLFQAALAKNVPFRIYGEIVGTQIGGLLFDGSHVHSSVSDPPFLWQYSRDVDKIAGRIEEWDTIGVPRFVFMLLPNDHTLGCDSPNPSPRSMVADNDLATGRFVDWLTHSPYWATSVAFLVEDDPQTGVDHVDGHRTILVAISPYARRGYVSSVLYHEGNLLAAVEHLLGLDPLTVYDTSAQPMWDMFSMKPDLAPFDELPRRVPEEMSMPGTNCGFATAGLDFLDADHATGLDRILTAHEREAMQR